MEARRSKSRQARLGYARRGIGRLRLARQAWPGISRQSYAVHRSVSDGKAGVAVVGKSCRVASRSRAESKAGEGVQGALSALRVCVLLGTVARGMARQARRCAVRHGTAWS